jgi:hypothetical protein
MEKLQEERFSNIYPKNKNFKRSYQTIDEKWYLSIDFLRESGNGQWAIGKSLKNGANHYCYLLLFYFCERSNIFFVDSIEIYEVLMKLVAKFLKIL